MNSDYPAGFYSVASATAYNAALRGARRGRGRLPGGGGQRGALPQHVRVVEAGAHHAVHRLHAVHVRPLQRPVSTRSSPCCSAAVSATSVCAGRGATNRRTARSTTGSARAERGGRSSTRPEVQVAEERSSTGKARRRRTSASRGRDGCSRWRAKPRIGSPFSSGCIASCGTGAGSPSRPLTWATNLTTTAYIRTRGAHTDSARDSTGISNTRLVRRHRARLDVSLPRVPLVCSRAVARRAARVWCALGGRLLDPSHPAVHLFGDRLASGPRANPVTVFLNFCLHTHAARRLPQVWTDDNQDGTDRP